MGKVLLIVGILFVLGGLGGGWWGYYEYWQHAAGYESEANSARSDLERGTTSSYARKRAREKIEEATERATTVKGEAYTRWGASGGGLVVGIVLIIVGLRKKPKPAAA